MMTGFDILLIVIVLAMLWVFARHMEERERWANRQELREETWRKIKEIERS